MRLGRPQLRGLKTFKIVIMQLLSVSLAAKDSFNPSL